MSAASREIRAFEQPAKTFCNCRRCTGQTKKIPPPHSQSHFRNSKLYLQQ